MAHETAVLYARVSTDEQADHGYGLQSQLRELRALAKERGYTIGAEYVDDGWSGALLDRPKLDALRQVIRDRGADVVLAHAPDRLARDLMHLLVLRNEMRKAGVKLEYSSYTPD